MISAARFAAALVVAFALVACSKVTPENYERVKEGMTEVEVTAILGKPDDTSSVAILGLTGTSDSWVGNEYSIMIQFVNGKVRLKSLGRTDIR